MLNASRFCVFLSTIIFFGAPSIRAADLAKAIALQAKMAEVQKIKGFADPKLNLKEATEQLSQTYGITIHVNERAFKFENIAEIMKTPICDPDEIPAFTGTLSLMLTKILAKVPAPSGAVFIIRGDRIEITTEKFRFEEFYRNRPDLGNNILTPFPPLVHAAIVNVPLVTALRDLARTYNMNIVVDVRASKDAQTSVTAEFENVPIDTAVSLLANMSDLTTVEVGNVIYVTTKENGRALQQEQERRRLKALEKPETPKER